MTIPKLPIHGRKIHHQPSTAHEPKNQIAKQSSRGYNYAYTSLADFAKQGFVIPVMRTKATELGEYVEYKDENGEWQQGAKVVMLNESKSMNTCQAYGAALSYARRYTVAMALGIATDDDDKVENKVPRQANAQGQDTVKELPASDAQLRFIKSLMEKNGVADAVIKETLTKTKTMRDATQLISKLKGGN